MPHASTFPVIFGCGGLCRHTGAKNRPSRGSLQDSWLDVFGGAPYGPKRHSVVQRRPSPPSDVLTLVLKGTCAMANQ